MAVTPAEYVELGDGIFHDYSYQAARHYELPIGGVYVARPGYMLSSILRTGTVITHLDGHPVPNLDAFVKAVEGIADKQAFTLKSLVASEPHRPRVATANMDRTWFDAQRCRRVDGERGWACVPLRPAPDSPTLKPVTAAPMMVTHKIARKLATGMVMVRFRVPYRTNGVYSGGFVGVGLVVDAEKGLVLVDRDTVTVGLGDVKVSFASSVEVDAEVVALHPQHNLALIRYDPKAIGETQVKAIRFDGARLEPGDKAFHVGMSMSDRIDAEPVTVSDLRGLSLPLPSVPFFRQINLELIDTKGAEAGFMGGVLTDKRGRASAMIASFPIPDDEDGASIWRGIPGRVVNAFLQDSSGGLAVGVEWGATGLIHARERGISDAHAAALEAHDPEKRQVLKAVRVTRGSPADGVVEAGDILLSINDAPVSRIGEWSQAVQGSEMTLNLLRGQQEVSVTLKPQFQSSKAFHRVLQWGGALFQAPHQPLASQRGQPTDGVYVSYWWRGSPAGRYGLRPLRRVVSVDGVATPDLDAFAAAVIDKADGEAVRLTTVDLKGRKRMITMKADTDYWPLVELSHGPSGWARHAVRETANGDIGADGGADADR
jgi:S1-C subfamily serine protease